MPPDDPPPDVLKLPASGWRPALRLRPRGSGCELTDWGRGRALVRTLINTIFTLLMLPLVAGVIHSVWLARQPMRPGTRPPDLASLALGFSICFALLGGLWIGLRVITRTHRRFTLQLDPERRVCIAKATTLGVARRRVELPLAGACADVTATVYRPPARENNVSLALVLLTLVTGPLGLILIALRSARRSRQPTDAPAVEAVTLLLYDEHDRPRVAVTSGDETATAGFLAAWDAATRR